MLAACLALRNEASGRSLTLFAVSKKLCHTAFTVREKDRTAQALLSCDKHSTPVTTADNSGRS
jgi:hypothetical protein